MRRMFYVALFSANVLMGAFLPEVIKAPWGIVPVVLVGGANTVLAYRMDKEW